MEQAVCKNAAGKIKGMKFWHFLYFFIFLEIVWLVSYYLSPLGRATLNSDLTTGVQFLEQVLKEKTLYPKNWIYTNTIGFPITIIVNIMLYFITGDYITTTMLHMAVCVLFMAAAVWYFARQVLQMRKSMAAAALIILLSPGSMEYFNDVFYSGYSMRIAVFLLMLGFGLQCMRNDSLKLNRKYLCLYAAFIFLFVTGDMRYVATVILPLFVASAVSYLTENYKAKSKEMIQPLKRYVLYLLVTGLTVLLCMMVEKYLKGKFTFVDGYFGASLIANLSDMWGNIKNMLQSYLYAFGFAGGVPQMSVYSVRSLCSLVFAAYIVVVNPILLLAEYKKQPFLLKQLIIFRWVGYAVTMYFWIFTGGVVFRHAITFLVLDIILAVYYFSVKIMLDGKVIKVFGCVVMCAYVAFNWSLGSWLDLDFPWKSQEAIGILEGREQIIKEIKDRGLTFGYAPYWTASLTSAFSQQEVRIYPWNINERYRWYSPADLYLPPEQEEATFLLLPDASFEENAQLYSFQNLWGDYKEEVRVSGHVILVYDYNIAVNFGEFAYLSDNMLKNMSIPETNRQRQSDGGTIYLEPEEYVFGPYVTLADGVYTLNVEVDGEIFLNAYAVETKDGQSTVNSICQTQLQKGSNEVAFFLSEDMERVEFHITNKDKKQIALTKLALERGGENALLSQMLVSGQETETTEDSRCIAPGEVMYGPYIEAKKGTYRVKIDLDRQTQLDIWAEKGQKTFAHEELSAGENEMSFVLPVDVTDLEFVIRNTDSKELKVTGLQLEKMEDI